MSLRDEKREEDNTVKTKGILKIMMIINANKIGLELKYLIIIIIIIKMQIITT